MVHNTRTAAGYTASRRNNIQEGPSCDPRHDTKKCSGGDVYWYDACGDKNDKAQECDDSNECTDDCKDGACSHTPRSGSCDDGDGCTVGDRCEGGKCRKGQSRDCSGVEDRCHLGECRNGDCVKVPRYDLPQERCNGEDENCDGATDEGCDKDGDGWCTVEMICEGTNRTCPKGCGDCNDAPGSGGVHPGAAEACNAIDDDCDGDVDEGFPDTDGDKVPDCLDPDDDNDGVDDAADTCPRDPNPVQADSDHDGRGDVCDPDDDDDGIPDDGDGSGAVNDLPCGTGVLAGCDDNCRTVANSHIALAEGLPPELAMQSDADGDGVGDACDPDVDGDGVPNEVDNCPRWPNPDQADHDGDAAWGGGRNWRHPGSGSGGDDPRRLAGGDACDLDDDNDGVPDDGDGTPGGRKCASGELVQCDDNCPFVANGLIVAPGLDPLLGAQADSDGDGLGDACDPDIDSDGVPNEVDNCPRWPNPDQLDHDNDAVPGVGEGANLAVPGGLTEGLRLTTGGDACDSDDDGDGVPDDGDGSGQAGDAPCRSGQRSGCDDNCRFVANPEGMVAAGLDPLLGDQSDVDGDGLGDACDPDMDGDGVANEVDACPRWQDPGQVDHDGDAPPEGAPANLGYPEQPHAAGDPRGLVGGDACDADDDGDGVRDASDNCPFVANSADLVAEGVDPLLGDQSDVDGDGIGDA
ncbi:MAG: thrombospondin type 3 repeat-containing protein, partial [Deltaproteobacteria bacterium]|nr:thrombospondin type 3 repeat-containing protein [Deltaproteobacteria bacterium]